MTTNEAIGQRVHSLMWNQRITQEALALALGISQTAVSKKVRGKRPWSVDELLAASIVLGTKPSEILASVSGYVCNDYPERERRSRKITAEAVAA